MFYVSICNSVSFNLHLLISLPHPRIIKHFIVHYPLWQPPPFLLSYEFDFSGISYKKNHRMFALLWQTSHTALRLIHSLKRVKIIFLGSECTLEVDYSSSIYKSQGLIHSTAKIKKQKDDLQFGCPCLRCCFSCISQILIFWDFSIQHIFNFFLKI